ncbi:PREDICTED: basement membrane-specific heparan sulfate proteoglycan core protein-like [Priapulus caudatus]|uniref:Basement membrane-specific heparan sulfate proteoglycan core protein-like n=1 Tax=Priapulus caudatus TaxID=37621 RepID=A0ABM1EP84_PRICU|nr:PREDICTED: basement membrane-specific heparan sulfate proteoglycan core protein-like [Priapulus caudatus]XP_014674005.1 PREDICTED: basement membrane-specific heparan sulfate proteoglycan core protein-like [Priapulus caudatus]
MVEGLRRARSPSSRVTLGIAVLLLVCCLPTTQAQEQDSSSRYLFPKDSGDQQQLADLTFSDNDADQPVEPIGAPARYEREDPIASPRNEPADDEDYNSLYGSGYGSGDEEEGGESGEVEVTYPDDYPIVYRMKINFTSIEFSKDLEDRNTKLFKETSERIAREIEALYLPVPGQQLVIVAQYRPNNVGSSMVTSDLTADGQHNEVLLRNAVWDSVRRGRIGGYTVSSDGFQFTLLRGKAALASLNLRPGPPCACSHLNTALCS